MKMNLGPGGEVQTKRYTGEELELALKADTFEFIKSRCSFRSEGEFQTHQFTAEHSGSEVTILEDNILTSDISFNWTEECK